MGAASFEFYSLCAVRGGCGLRTVLFEFSELDERCRNLGAGLLSSASRRLSRILPRHIVRADGPGTVLVLCKYLHRLKGRR